MLVFSLYVTLPYFYSHDRKIREIKHLPLFQIISRKKMLINISFFCHEQQLSVEKWNFHSYWKINSWKRCFHEILNEQENFRIFHTVLLIHSVEKHIHYFHLKKKIVKTSYSLFFFCDKHVDFTEFLWKTVMVNFRNIHRVWFKV